MKKLLYNINSTSWFHRLKNGKIIKLEVFYIIMSICAFISTIGLAYDVLNDQEFSNYYLLGVSAFILFSIQYVIYSSTAGKAPQEVQDQFWKTQLWRFKDPSYDGKQEYPNWRLRLEKLENRWYQEYGETSEKSLMNAPRIQKYRFLILIGPPLIVVILASIIKFIIT